MAWDGSGRLGRLLSGVLIMKLDAKEFIVWLDGFLSGSNAKRELSYDHVNLIRERLADTIKLELGEIKDDSHVETSELSLGKPNFTEDDIPF